MELNKEAVQQSCEKSSEDQPWFRPLVMKKSVKTIRCSSHLSEEEFSYVWKLSNFNEIPFVSGYPIYSPAFYINKKNSSRWQIVMTKHTCYRKNGNDEGDCTSGSEDEDESLNAGESEIKKDEREKIRRIGFRLEKYENTPQIWDAVRYSFTVGFADSNFEDTIEVSTKEREEPGLAVYQGLPKVPRYAYLTDKDFGVENLFEESFIRVTCNINYSYIEGGTTFSPVAYDGKRFVDDLRVLFMSNRYADVSVNVNGEPYEMAHKIVLNAAARGLEQLLEEPDQKKAKFDLKLDSEVGKAMVHFIYSGKIVDGFPLEKCVDLHDAGNRYGVDCLGQYCSKYFTDNLASDICRECLGIAEGAADCLASVKKLGKETVEKILAKVACCHKNHGK